MFNGDVLEEDLMGRMMRSVIQLISFNWTYGNWTEGVDHFFIKTMFFPKENAWHCDNCTTKICDYKCHNLELMVHGCPKNIWPLAYFCLDGNINQAYCCYHETYYHRAAHSIGGYPICVNQTLQVLKELLENPTINIHVGGLDNNENYLLKLWVVINCCGVLGVFDGQDALEYRCCGRSPLMNITRKP